ncbi:site-specific DNA-methyltransferase [Rhodococcus sp. 06-1460-1B]|uniref:site-specific DNA-methyltransferase n=1 Tax=Rhodococcus sp. 06-1460-1B TaxID=2022501 RepID=UPI000B9C0DBE|nr:DNA methyltransferase [Rhodococcus sp. 06-1460-1B]OZD53577.1 hypothetical protein CH268_27180 [Rhodococcus sp. 06-1460-1B]
MASSARSQRLELTWFNKDRVLIPAERGKYGYAWVDPHNPRYSEIHTLVETDYVCGERKEKLEGTAYSDLTELEPSMDNLLVWGESGDVLESLRYVPEFAAQYLGNIKLCYIDPPFNTEKAFPNYEDNLEHSIWLTMMRDRMLHIKELLADDGSIWVHLDNSENHRMRCLLDEIFGAGNFVAEVAWEKKDSPKMDDEGVSITHDTITCYRKSENWSPNKFGVEATEKDFPKVTTDGRRYSSRELRKWGKNSLRTDRPTMWYPITAPDGTNVYPIRPDGREGCWRWKRKMVDANYESLEWLEMPAPVGLTPYVRSFMDDGKKPVPPTSIWQTLDVGGNPVGKEEIKALFPGEDPFSTPKPERLLERIIHIGSNPGDIVLDVFAGSGTTAAVAHKMGRRWVTAELIEDTLTKFTLPRLTKVVCGEDPGGVTSTVERVSDDGCELPGDMSAAEARVFNSTLTKLAKVVDTPVDVAKEIAKLVRARAKENQTSLTEDEGKLLNSLLRKLSKDPEPPIVDLFAGVTKQLREATRTRDAATVNWLGGGSFRVMELSPKVFDVDPKLGLVVLTENARGQVLISAIAANLGFTCTPSDPHFHGRLGSMKLLVIEGPVSEEDVADAVAVLGNQERVTIAATGVPDGMRAALRKASRGSRILHVPDDLFATLGDNAIEMGIQE